MIDAAKARFESRHRSRINDILADCEREIEEAVKKGEYSTTVSIYIATTPEEIYDEILKELHNLGYETCLHDERIRTKDFPCDQCAYWEYLDISWEETK